MGALITVLIIIYIFMVGVFKILDNITVFIIQVLMHYNIIKEDSVVSVCHACGKRKYLGID
jgi:hypothetical protein